MFCRAAPDKGDVSDEELSSDDEEDLEEERIETEIITGIFSFEDELLSQN